MQYEELIALLINDNPNDIIFQIILESALELETEFGELYLLDHFQNKYVLKFAIDKLDGSKYISKEDEAYSQLINNCETLFDINGQKLIIPIWRKNAGNEKFCLGILIFRSVKEYNKEIQKKIESRCPLIILSINRLYLKNLLEKINQPIDFTQGEKEYFDEIITQISDASSLPFIALRQFDDENLLVNKCSSGFDNVGKYPPDFSNNMPQVFQEVIDTKQIKQVTLNQNDFDGFYEYLHEIGIKQIVVIPIIIGTKMWGVLSFATKTNYYFNVEELLGLDTIAHGIGVSVSNFMNFHRNHVTVFENAQTAVLITGIEVAQSVRHEASNIIAEMQLAIKLLKNNDKYKNNEQLNLLSQKMNELSPTIQKIKTATTPPEKKLQIINLHKVIEDSRRMVQGRLEEQHITVKIDNGLNVNFNGYEEWLRHAFLNLFMNSIDAFKSRGKKQNREISLVLDTNFNEKIKFIYTDNAGGIDNMSLHIPSNISNEVKQDMNRLIFEKNVSSKKVEGSGFGLFLTRDIIQSLFKGSINLSTNKSNTGITFLIELSKNIEK